VQGEEGAYKAVAGAAPQRVRSVDVWPGQEFRMQCADVWPAVLLAAGGSGCSARMCGPSYFSLPGVQSSETWRSSALLCPGPAPSSAGHGKW
jgi:hypothetical protein